MTETSVKAANLFGRRLRRKIIGVFRPHDHAFFSRVPQLWCGQKGDVSDMG
jgi:hypothetical protein